MLNILNIARVRENELTSFLHINSFAEEAEVWIIISYLGNSLNHWTTCSKLSYIQVANASINSFLFVFSVCTCTLTKENR